VTASPRAGNFTATTLRLPGPLLVTGRRFADERGHFVESFSARDLAVLGIEETFVQDNESLSRLAGTIRGLHHQAAPRMQAKLVRVLRGAIFDVAVDLRRASPAFGRHVAVELVAGDDRLLFIPAGFAHGFCTLRDDTEIAYKVTASYDPALDRAIAWDDPALGIAWPVAADAAILSAKDRAAPLLADAPDLPA
jgi:dTDP-4-dehydrorhamnose 3,5-epimerase